jgi:hypothetical protein
LEQVYYDLKGVGMDGVGPMRGIAYGNREETEPIAIAKVKVMMSTTTTVHDRRRASAAAVAFGLEKID